MYAIVPDTSMFLDFETLKSLFGYMKHVPICMSNKTSGLSFERVLSSLDLKTFENNRSEIDIFKELLRHCTNSLQHLSDCYTAGFASARVECLFSSLTAIDTAQRRSMTSKLEADLTYLLFESKTLQSLTFDDFLKEWKKKLFSIFGILTFFTLWLINSKYVHVMMIR